MKSITFLFIWLVFSIHSINCAVTPTTSPPGDIQAGTYSILTTYNVNNDDDQSTDFYADISSTESSGKHRPPISSPSVYQTKSNSDTDTEHSIENASHKNTGNDSVMQQSDDALVIIDKSRNTAIVPGNDTLMTQLPVMNMHETQESYNKSNNYSSLAESETNIISDHSSQRSSHSNKIKNLTTITTLAVSKETIDPEDTMKPEYRVITTDRDETTISDSDKLYLSYLLDSFVLRMCNVSKLNNSNIFRLTLQLEWIFLRETKKLKQQFPIDKESIDKLIDSVKKLQLCKMYRIDDNSVSNTIQNVRTTKLGVVRKVTIGLMAAGILCILMALYYFGYKLHRKLNPKPIQKNKSKQTDTEKPTKRKNKHQEYLDRHNAAFVNCWM